MTRTPLRSLPFFLLCLPAVAQDGAPQPAPQPNPQLVIDQGEHLLKNLVHEVSTFARVNIVLPDELTGIRKMPVPRVHLTRTSKLAPTDAIRVLSQLAHSVDFMLTPVDLERRTYELINIRGSRRAVIQERATPMSREELVRSRGVYMYAQHVLELKHLSATRAGQQLRPFLSGQGSALPVVIAAVGDAALLVQGLPDRILALVETMDKIDRPQPERPDSLQKKMLTRLGELEKQVKALGERLDRLAR